MLNIEFRRFASVGDTFGRAASFAQLVAATKSDSEIKRKIREARTKDERQALKVAGAPCWYTGGAVSGHFCEGAITPAGIAQFDLDADASPERLAELKRRLSEIPCVFFVALSVSGRGVYALARVPVAVQNDQAAQAELLALVDAVVLYDRLPGESFDDKCAKSAQRRFESFDPEPFLRDNPTEYTLDYRAVCEEAFRNSSFHAIATDFGGRGAITPGCAQTGFAMAITAIHAGGRVAGRLFGEEYYIARSQVVILGESGAGKSNMQNCLMEAAADAGAQFNNSCSDRDFEAKIVESCTDVSYEIGDNGKPDKDRPIWTQKVIPQPLLGVFDEAAEEQEARRKTEYKLKLNSLRRRCFDRRFTASSSRSTKLPSFPLRCSYTDVQIATPAAWASAMSGLDQTRGEKRRQLEFWLASPETPDGARNARYARFISAIMDKPPAAKPRAVNGFLEFSAVPLDMPDEEGISLRLDGRANPFELALAAREIARISPSEAADLDARTIVANLATLLAYAIGQTERIDDNSLRAAWAIYFAVLDNRKRLNEAADIGPETQESRISGAILDYIREAGEPRVSSVNRMLNKRGPSYKRAYLELVSNGALVVTRGKSPTVRLATPEEAEASAAAQPAGGPDFTEERANREKVARNNAERAFETMQAAEYAQASEEGKRAKLEAYRREHEKEPGHEIVRGQRDPSLRSLATKLHNAGLDDAFAEAWFFELCHGCGDEFARESTKRRLWRDAPQRT